MDGATSLGMILKRPGCTTEVVHDVLQPIDAAMRFRPDVVLLDIGCPPCTGTK